MKHVLKTLAAIALLGAASMTAHAQTYKPDWATKLILAKNGNDPSKKVTLLAGANTVDLTLTLPTTAPGGDGYLLAATTDGAMSWVNPAASVILAGDVTGAANSNTVTKINGATLGTTTATSGNILIADGAQWVTRALSGDITIDNTGVSTIGSGKVTTTKIADGAVTTVKIADANVTTAKIADANITTVKILDANVTSAKIADDAVTTAKILDANVTTAKIATGAVTATQLAADAVTTTKILDANVTTAKIATGAVTATQLASDAVTTAKILDANVTTAKIADDAITTAKILDANVTNAKLANSSLTVTAGSGLAGGGSVSLGGTTTITANIQHDASLTGIGTAGSNLTLNTANANTWTGTQTLGGVAMTASAPSTYASNQNDLALSGSNSYFRLQASANISITGIANGADGRVIVLTNVGTSENSTNFNITLTSEDAGSTTAGDRFHLAGNESIILAPDAVVTLVYDGGLSRWRLVSAQ